MGIKNLLNLLATSTTVFANVATQNERNDTTRIIGGVPARAGEFPSMVSVQLNYRGHICGGALLDSTTVLTAAHCPGAIRMYGYTASNMAVRAGSLKTSSGGILANVTAMFVHPRYDFRDLDADVAILKLSAPIAKSNTVGYATLAAAGSDPSAGSMVTAAGWGYNGNYLNPPKSLMKVEIPIVSREECRIRYKAEYEPGLPRAITRNMFCAGYIEDNEVFNEKDTCSGDSGGPVVDSKTGTLIGVVSWGAEGCGTDGLLGVNARVGSVRDFIDRYL